ncbi:MAG TPA: Lrp/AsnC family transcriptional regulator [Hadesarchaea archaeon]|nr:Lrp/AsnC family transcriptional regulator [Hadesarchaea archaeon]
MKFLKIDKEGNEILKILEENSRTPLREIAKHLRSSEGMVHHRIERMKKDGIIERFSIVVNPEKIGIELTALVQLKISGPDLWRAMDELATRDEVRCVYSIPGDYNILLFCRFRDMKHLNEFLVDILEIRSVERSMVLPILKKVKEDFTVLRKAPRPATL